MRTFFERFAGTTTWVRLAAAASLSALVIAFLVLAYSSYHAALETAGRLVKERTAALENQLQRVVEVGDLLLLLQQHEMRAALQSDVPSRPSLNRRLRQIVSLVPYVFRLFILDTDGSVYATSMDRIPDVNAKRREYFRFHEEVQDGLKISPPLYSQATGEPILILSRRISGPRGEFRGVAIVSFDLRRFTAFAERVVPDTEVGRFQLVGPGMEVLLDSRAAPGESGRVVSAWTQSLLAAGGVDRSEALDGVDRIWGHGKVGPYPLYVRYGIPAKSVVAAWRLQIAPYALLCLVAFVALAGLSMLAVKRTRMAERAHAARERTNVELERRVRERTADLERSNRALGGALADKEVLFKEVHHRVNNNLQVILSMIHMEAFRAPESARSVFSSISTRVHAIALVHRTLYGQEESARVDVSEYLRELASVLISLHGTQGEMVGWEVEAKGMLPLDVAVPLGLIASEVINNALKYAFAGVDAPRLRVSFATEGGEARLTVADNGRGFDINTVSHGTGLRIIASLARQLEGTFEYVREEGCAFRLVFPAPAATTNGSADG